LDELRTFAVSRLTDIRKLIAHPESIDQARAALAEQFGSFTLEPISRDGKATYLAHGKVDFFGDEAMARTGGAGEGKWTEGLPIHLDGWLPRNCQVGGAGKYLRLRP
jgi:hypothetical protein